MVIDLPDTEVTYCMNVTNNGENDLHLVEVRDEDNANFLCEIGDMAVGASDTSCRLVSYVPSVEIGSQSPPATVTGLDPENDQVSDTDPAGVTPLVPGEEGCLEDLSLQGDDLCLPGGVVSLLKVTTASGEVLPADYDIQTILYGLDITTTDDEVTFKVDNPFDFAVDMYVSHAVQAAGSTSGQALDQACDKAPQVPGCNPDASVITAKCISHPGGPSFSIVTVAFVSNDSSIQTSDAALYECCELEKGTESYGTISYTFEVLCECPPVDEQRKLRVPKRDSITVWEDITGLKV